VARDADLDGIKKRRAAKAEQARAAAAGSFTPPAPLPVNLGIRSWRHRMAGHDLRQRVEVSDDDRTVATAEVITSEGSGGTARVSLRAEPGHITPGRRACLVDAVLDLPEVQQSARVEAAFRLGDGESLHRLQERFEDVSTRPAGWSVLLDADLPSRRAGQHVPDSTSKEPLPGRITIAQPQPLVGQPATSVPGDAGRPPRVAAQNGAAAKGAAESGSPGCP
jgi:hypothetical protein